MSGNVLRGPVLPSLIAIGVLAASVAGTIALTGKDSTASASSPTRTAPPPVRNAAWVVNGAHDAPSLSALTGFWIGPDVVVRGGVDGLHAMKRADGSPPGTSRHRAAATSAECRRAWTRASASSRRRGRRRPGSTPPPSAR
ncbi:hypothetical protein ACFQ9X_02595 [Catenulispora yoronensis]